MTRWLRFVVLVMLGHPAAGLAQAVRPKVVFGDTSALEVLEPEAVIEAIRRRYIRQATGAERSRVVAANASLASNRATIYFVQDTRALPLIGSLGGADARAFIVSPRVQERQFGRGHSMFVTPAGGCLQGECGSCAPTAHPAYTSAHLPGWCNEPVPLAPPAPPALPRSRR